MDQDGISGRSRDPFFRGTDWRWQRAGYLAHSDRQCDPRIDDEWVDLGRAFQVASTVLIECDSSGESWRAICAAQALWRNSDSTVRDVVEACLLAGMSFPEVATTGGLSVRIVEAYAQLFFDVQSRLGHRDWIVLNAIGACPWTKIESVWTGSALRLLAYAGGPMVLDSALAVLQDRPFSPEQIAAFADAARDEPRLRLRIKLFIRLLAARSDREFVELAKLYVKLRELELRMPSAGIERNLEIDDLNDLNPDQIVRPPSQPTTACRERNASQTGPDLSEQPLAAAG